MIIIKRWKEEMGIGYKESLWIRKREKKKKKKDMKEEINDFHILALL